jgi:hypothetical protein
MKQGAFLIDITFSYFDEYEVFELLVQELRKLKLAGIVSGRFCSAFSTKRN